MPVVLSGAEWQLYEDARLAALSDLEIVLGGPARAGAARRGAGGAHAPQAARVAPAPLRRARSTLDSSKRSRRFLGLVEELCAEGSARSCSASSMVAPRAALREALEARGVAYVYLDGETPRKARAEWVREFQGGVGRRSF